MIIPIIGARTADQLKENLGCLEFTLSQEHVHRLDEITKIDLGFPHDFLNSEIPRELIYGGTLEEIDNHRGR